MDLNVFFICWKWFQNICVFLPSINKVIYASTIKGFDAKESLMAIFLLLVWIGVILT